MLSEVRNLYFFLSFSKSIFVVLSFYIYKDGEQAAFHLSFYFPFKTLLIKGILSAIASFKFCMILQNRNHSLNKGALYLFILVAYKDHKEVETSSD